MKSDITAKIVRSRCNAANIPLFVVGMIEIHENPDTYFERVLAAELRRRAGGAGLTIGELVAQADLNRRTFERWLAGETTLGLRRYLALLRVVRHAEKMHERAERRS